MPPPQHYHPDDIPLRKPDIPSVRSSPLGPDPDIDALKTYDGPQAFSVPGNHDWFDGLQTFLRFICHRGWLGGWVLPQRKSYFALQLPHGWWLFGMDNALHEDIDVHQFQYFARFASFIYTYYNKY